MRQYVLFACIASLGMAGDTTISVRNATRKPIIIAYHISQRPEMQKFDISPQEKQQLKYAAQITSLQYQVPIGNTEATGPCSDVSQSMHDMSVTPRAHMGTAFHLSHMPSQSMQSIDSRRYIVRDVHISMSPCQGTPMRIAICEDPSARNAYSRYYHNVRYGAA